MLKRKNYWLLFAVLLLALTSLSPSMELDTTEEIIRQDSPSGCPSSRIPGIKIM